MAEVDDVMVLQKGSTWSPVPCEDWHEWGYDRGFDSGTIVPPSPEVWCWMAGAISLCAPFAAAAVGPTITGGANPKRDKRYTKLGEFIEPRLILIALVDNFSPLETAFHECFHAVESRITFDEMGFIDAYCECAAKSLVDQGLDSYLVREDERGAYFFGKWAVGEKPVETLPSDCIEIFDAIKTGKVGSRPG